MLTFRGSLGLLPPAIAAMLVGCGAEEVRVDFTRAEPTSATSGVAAQPAGTLRIAVASVLSPLPTANRYQQWADYLGEKLERPVELVQGKTYAQINALVKSGDVTPALVCTNPDLQGQDDFGMERRVAPQVNGDTTYYSLLIVQSTSKASSLSDLRGASFAFSDPLSNTGRLAPLYQLALMGEGPDSFFGHTTFTYAHDSSIRAVAGGIVRAATGDSLVFDYLLIAEPKLVGKVKAIGRWGPFGINPVVVNPRLAPPTKEELRQPFLDMDKDPHGQERLRSLVIDRFVVLDDRTYDSVREKRSYLQERGLAL